MGIYQKIIRKIPVEKGFSGDKKFCAETSDGQKYLLRVAPAERYERKCAEFAHMKAAAALEIPMCLPLELGHCEDGVYTIHSWISGTDAESVIGDLSSRQQYDYGLDAGRYLRKLHTLPAPEDLRDWETFFNGKIDRKIAMYEACPLKYDRGELFLDYLAKNRGLLADRPQTYQHGDYHIGNMMIDEEAHLVIIDFDRDDIGDPWEEFNRIVWSARSTPYFACGIVDGYFDGTVPMEFWKLLALYMCSNALSSLPWAIPYGEEEIQTMRDLAAHMLQWYDNMQNVVPTWYRKP